MAKKICSVCGQVRPRNWRAEGWETLVRYTTHRAKTRYTLCVCKAHRKQLSELMDAYIDGAWQPQKVGRGGRPR